MSNTDMRAIEAQTFSGYGGLRQIELPKPQPAKSPVLVRITAAGVTPLDYTILSGGHPRAKAPLILGNEGAGVIEDAGDSGLAVGSRVMFTGPYGVRENGAWQEWLLVRTALGCMAPLGEDMQVASSSAITLASWFTSRTANGASFRTTSTEPRVCACPRAPAARRSSAARRAQRGWPAAVRESAVRSPRSGTSSASRRRGARCGSGRPPGAR